jgi:threonylcarbamoyladenosine tRNA methylthiotransferase MtaB
MAETNQWSQILVNQGFSPTKINPNLVFINTCAITKKGEVESLGKVRHFQKLYPKAKIYVTGCANLEKVKELPNVFTIKNDDKELFLKKLKSSYTPKIKDKFSHTNRFLLKIQSGCTQFCSYCIVPQKRPILYSLTPKDAISTVKKAIVDGYEEVIITGVNIDNYQYNFSNLIKNILKQTNIKLISFGSIPLNCITKDFIKLFENYPNRLSNFLHIPIQSGSEKILKLMNRPYTKKDIIKKINKLKITINNLKLGTDIIVGFPTETEKDFQETLNLCKETNFTKIHCFRFSPRPNTKAKLIFNESFKISKEILKNRSQQIRNLV